MRGWLRSGHAGCNPDKRGTGRPVPAFGVNVARQCLQTVMAYLSRFFLRSLAWVLLSSECCEDVHRPPTECHKTVVRRAKRLSAASGDDVLHGSRGLNQCCPSRLRDHDEVSQGALARRTRQLGMERQTADMHGVAIILRIGVRSPIALASEPDRVPGRPRGHPMVALGIRDRKSVV